MNELVNQQARHQYFCQIQECVKAYKIIFNTHSKVALAQRSLSATKNRTSRSAWPAIRVSKHTPNSIIFSLRINKGSENSKELAQSTIIDNEEPLLTPLKIDS